MSKWIRTSEFGPGPRKPMTADQRKVFTCQARQLRQAEGLTANAWRLAETMAYMQGADGQLNPTHAFLATSARMSVATVKRSLNELRRHGLVTWVNRIVRSSTSGWRVEQTSNAYQLHLLNSEAQNEPEARTKILRKRVASQFGSYPQTKPSGLSDLENAARQLRAIGVAVPAHWNQPTPIP